MVKIMSKSKIEQKRISKTERKQVVNTLINSYELLEEKLNQTDDKIEKLEVKLKGDKNQEEKRDNSEIHSVRDKIS